jgi:cbb3-type cytochrome oxidase maturation protein
MSVIYVLLTISIVVAVVFFAAFIFSVRSGQYDDSYTPSVRILFEDELVIQKENKTLPNDKKELPISKRKQL